MTGAITTAQSQSQSQSDDITMTKVTSSAPNTTTDILMLFIRAAGLKSRNDVKATTNLFGAADPFFKVTNDSGEIVAQSVVLFNDLNPQWPPIKLDLTALCDNDDGKAVTISFFDYQSKKEEHELIGSVTTSVEEMKQAAKDCQAQRNVTLLNKKESYRLAVDDNNTNVDDNNRARVYIYDLILTTGTPTVGTLFKKKQLATNNNNNNGSQDSTTPSSDSTEPESDSSSEEEGHQKTDQMENSLQDDLPESVCALSVWSNDSTIGVANGDASPSRSVASSSKTKGGTILMGGCMPAVTEEEESLPTKLSSDDDDDHSIPNLDDYDAPDSPHVLAQQRGAEMAQQADTEEEVEGPDRLTLDIENFVGESLLSGDLIMNETDDDDDITDENESSVDSSSFNDSSVRTDNVRDLLGEIDDILTGFNDNPRSSKPNEAATQQEVAETVSLPPTTQPALKPRNRIARLMSRKSNVSTPPPRRSTNNHIQSPPELKSFADDDNFMNADRQPPSSPTAILDLNQKNSDLPTKQKQCLGRPKKEYLSNSE